MFLRVIRSGRLWMGERGGVFQTDDVGQGGVSKTFLLGRLSWMTLNFILLASINYNLHAT